MISIIDRIKHKIFPRWEEEKLTYFIVNRGYVKALIFLLLAVVVLWSLSLVLGWYYLSKLDAMDFASGLIG